jgi:hypothetical protein
VPGASGIASDPGQREHLLERIGELTSMFIHDLLRGSV